MKTQIINDISNQYGVEPEYLWPKTPDCCIFRHTSNRKWFAVIMKVAGNKLGLNTNQPQDIINVKCDAYLISTLCQSKGYFPAYHMNKQAWLSILLDGTVAKEEIIKLIDLSYELTR